MAPTGAAAALVSGRVVHGFGQTHGFCCVGLAGMGPVSDLLTHANTIPIMGYPQVSATRSHTRTHGWLYLPCATSHTYQGKSLSLSPPHHLSSTLTSYRLKPPTSSQSLHPLSLILPSPSPCHLPPHTASSPPSRGGLHPHCLPPHAILSPPPRSHHLETGLAHAISNPVQPRACHLEPTISRQLS